VAEWSLVLICEKCQAKNFLDPYAFWNFKGKTKCAGCDEIYAVELTNGQTARPPQRSTGAPDLLPGFAETKDYKPLAGPGKTRPGPKPRPDLLCKPKPIQLSIRGKPVSGRPLKKEELVDSRARFIVERTLRV
jgi:hypothetical protein